MHLLMHNSPPAGAAVTQALSAGLSPLAFDTVAFFRSDSPVSVKRWWLYMMRSSMASAVV